MSRAVIWLPGPAGCWVFPSRNGSSARSAGTMIAALDLARYAVSFRADGQVARRTASQGYSENRCCGGVQAPIRETRDRKPRQASSASIVGIDWCALSGSSHV